MKKIIYVAVVMVLPLLSCVSKKSADKLQGDKDSLAMIVAAKDSMINDVFLSLNGITENLNAIKVRENIISSAIDTEDIKKHSAARISEDIESINQLLIQNRETIAQLERSAEALKKADIKTTALENLIKQMTTQIESKDAEIGALKEELRVKSLQIDELNTKVTGLNTVVADLSETNTKLEGEVKSQGDILSTAYYIVGSQKELLAKEIVYKSGFIGRTLKINENRSLDSFTQVDIRSFEEIIIGRKGVVLVSSHPADSYEFVMSGKDVFSSLVITDKAKFWEYSKVLVVSYK